jgi:hypothetical protein
MKKIFTLILLLLSTASFSQLENEDIISKKDYILIQLFDVLESTTAIISNDSHLSYGDLRGKQIGYELYRKNTDYIDFWVKNAEEISEKTKNLIHDILEEMDTIAKLADSSKQEYIPRKGYDKMASTFYSLARIKNYNDRNVPNDRLIGDDVQHPNPKGLDIEKAIREYKIQVLHLMADYTYNNKSYQLNESVVNGEIQLDFSNVNPDDTISLRAVINTVPLQNKRYTKDLNSDKTIIIPWVSDQFRYSSVLETVVTAQRLILEIVTIEKIALRFINMKVPRARKGG